MNKKLQEYAAANGLVCEKEYCYGVFNGYQVSVYQKPLSTMWVIGINANFGAKLDSVISYLNFHKKDLKIANAVVGGGGLRILILDSFGTLKKADAVLRSVTAYLAQQEIDGSGCPYCGEPMQESALVTDNFAKFRAHEQCFNQKLEAAVSAEAFEKELPNRYGNGIVGALIGALVGCAIFAVLFAIGYLASISSMIGALLASFLYSKFGGKNNRVKIVIVSLATLLLILATFFICNIVYIGILMEENGVGGSAFEMLLVLCREEAEFRNALLGDLGLTLFFTVLGIVVVIISMVRQQRKVSSGMKKF